MVIVDKNWADMSAGEKQSIADQAKDARLMEIRMREGIEDLRTDYNTAISEMEDELEALQA